ncbi:MAG TPA: hypothetical protein PLV42_00315 [bacterium]|nr:hypothetical protein [bacterium]
MADNKAPLSMEGQNAATAGHGPTQLRLRAFEPRRKKRMTAKSELRAFLFILMLVLSLMIAALSLTTDPIGVLLKFLHPILPA